MKKILLIISILIGNIASAQWINVGDSEFSDGTAMFNNIKMFNDQTYVVYVDLQNDKKTTLKRYNGTTWVDIGISSFTKRVGTSLDFVFHNGMAHVAYDVVRNSGIPSIVKFNGTSWEGLPHVALHPVYNINLVSNGGLLYAAFADSIYDSKTTVMRFDGTVWNTVGIPGFSQTGISWLDLEFYNDIPYVAFKENDLGIDGGNKITVMRFNGVDWEVVGDRGFSVGQVEIPDLTFYQEKPCVAFVDESNNSKLSIMTYSEGNWMSLYDEEDFTEESVNELKLKEYNDKLYALYTANGIATLKKFNGITWEYLDHPVITDSNISDISLNFLDDEIYVAFSDTEGSEKLTVKKLRIQDRGMNTINVYPSPARNVLNIVSSYDNNINKVELRDLQGKIITQMTRDEIIYDSINIANLPTSIYILVIYSDKGVFSKKIIKK